MCRRACGRFDSEETTMNGMSHRVRVFLALCGLTALLAIFPVHAQKCPTKDQFKGVELYSWQAAEGWRFALLPGTNRLKTDSEIKSSSCTGSVDQMMEIISRLGDKQHVLWSHDKVSGLMYPPDAVVDRIAASARKHGIVLYGPLREGAASSNAELEACKSRESELNQRHAELARVKEEADTETARLERESADLAVKLRALNNGDREAVAAHNARALEHNSKALAHNKLIADLNERMTKQHEETKQMLSTCTSGALKLPKLEPAPGK
jgi:hypothetical protein